MPISSAGATGGGNGRDGPEVGRRPEREVDLQRVLEQEDAKERRAAPDVDVRDRAVIAVHPARPVADDVCDDNAVGNAQGEVDVGPAVRSADGSRPRVRCRLDAVVAPGRGDEGCPQLLTFLGSE
jgi:hypothetical protein